MGSIPGRARVQAPAIQRQRMRFFFRDHRLKAGDDIVDVTQPLRPKDEIYFSLRICAVAVMRMHSRQIEPLRPYDRTLVQNLLDKIARP